MSTAERYVHLVRAGSEPPAAGRLPERAHWCCSRQPEAAETVRGLTDRRVEVVPGLDEPLRAGPAVREVLRRHPRGHVVLVGTDAGLGAVAANLTGTDVGGPLPDVLTVRLESDADPSPLTLPVVLVVSLVLSLVDVGQWLVTGRPGLVVGPALVVAGLVAAPRATRDLGVSLMVAVLLAAFLDLSWLNFIPRLRM